MDCKTTKTLILCASVGPLRVSVDDIYEQHLRFYSLRRHARASGLPTDLLHADYGAQGVEVRWLWTERLGYFSPEVSFRPTSKSIEIADRVSRAIVPELPPEQVLAALRAYEVQALDGPYAAVRPGGTTCTSAYRILRAPGDGPLSAIARAAGT